MSKIIDIIGKRFGRLKVTKFNKLIEKRTYWNCICDCGKEIIIMKGSLLKGPTGTKSCGCSRAKKKGQSAFNSLFSNYKGSALRRNNTFNLSKKQFKKLTSSSCYYCGLKPSIEFKTKHSYGGYLYNGVDRKNNKCGYSFKNCVPCCKTCNFAKLTQTVKEFEEWLNRITIYRNRIRGENY